jgi:hypothetical protein
MGAPAEPALSAVLLPPLRRARRAGVLYAGDATSPPPPRPGGLDAGRTSGRLRVPRDKTRRGRHRELWITARIAGPGSMVTRGHRAAPDLGGRDRATAALGREGAREALSPRGGARRRRSRSGSRVGPASTCRGRCPSASTDGTTRASRATPWRRRSSPTACVSSPAPSSTTARGASSRPAPRSRTRWSSCGPAPSASPTHAPPRLSSTEALKPRARTAGPRSASTSCPGLRRSRPSCGRASTTRHLCGRRVSGRSFTSP